MLEDKINFLVRNRAHLVERDFIIDLFTHTEHETVKLKNAGADRAEATEHGDYKLNKIYSAEGKPHLSYVLSPNEKDTFCLVGRKPKVALFPPNVKMTLKKGMIDNYSGPPITTSYGIYLYNQIIFCHLFGDKFPYMNGATPKDITKWLENAIMDDIISPEKAFRVIDFFTFISDFNELNSPTFSKKAMTTHPDSHKVRDELMEKYKDRLDDPTIQEYIEKTLIELDKEHLKGDPSYDYFATNKKAFTITRKKQYCTVGSIESIGGGESTVFVGRSLSEEWDKNDMANIISEARSGFYDRGTSTAQGGELSKFLMRVFQDVLITEDDCGTTNYLNLVISKSNIRDFIGRTVFDKGKLVLITEDNYESFAGRPIKLRSPAYCKTKDGFCYTCVERTFKETGRTSIGTQSIGPGSKFLSLRMAAMHGTQLVTKKITDLNEFILRK